jgi:N-glycosylase/DNA lyase
MFARGVDFTSASTILVGNFDVYRCSLYVILEDGHYIWSFYKKYMNNAKHTALFKQFQNFLPKS